MKMKKTQMILTASAVAVICVMAAGFVNAKQSKNIIFERKNEYITSGANCQDNYLIYSEENGMHTFPYVWGGRLILMSMDSGKKYIIQTTEQFSQGFGQPSIIGNRIYYRRTWDGKAENQKLYISGLKSKKQESVALENCGACYATDGKHLYFTKSLHPSAGKKKNKSALYCRDLHSGKEREILQGDIAYIQFAGKYLMCYDEKKGTLIKIIPGKRGYEEYPISHKPKQDAVYSAAELGGGRLALCMGKSGIVIYDFNTEIKETLDEIGNLQDAGLIPGEYRLLYRKGRLYYNDMKGNVYKINVKTGERETVVDSKSLESGKPGNAKVSVSYCTDYIAVQTSSIHAPEKRREAYLFIFDYSGKLKSEIKNNKMLF